MTAKNDSFLPNGYEVPQAPSDYTKLKKGPNKLRILSAPILGYEYWTEDRKPVRSRELWNVIPADADISKGWQPKHFWAMVVWNHDAKAIQIWQPTQKTILVELQQLAANEDWGDPRGYNITINRTGEDLKTEYSVQPSPHTEIPAAVLAQYKEKKIDLNALFEGGNPFEATERSAEIDAPEFKPERPGFMKQPNAEPTEEETDEIGF
jgi:hypothetical protein